jgi:spore maturation protein CgeB
MRILVVHPGPSFSVADVYTGWMEGLTALGHQVQRYNLDERLIFYDSVLMENQGWIPGMGPTGDPEADARRGAPHNAEGKTIKIRKALTREQALSLAANGVLSTCFQFWPDVVLVVSCFYIPSLFLDIIRARGMRVVMLHTESPYSDDEQLARAAHADINLLNDPCNLQAYLKLGKPAYYMPHAYRPHIHNTGPGVLMTDFVFVGTIFPSRIEFFERMLATGHLDGLDLTFAGNVQAVPEGSPLIKYFGHDLTECVDNELTAKIYRSSKSGINIYRREAEEAHFGEGWALGPREVEMAACGLFFLRDRRGESDEVFPMVPTFESPEDAAEKLRWYIDHEDEREKITLQARAAIRDRTFANNARKLMEYLEKL